MRNINSKSKIRKVGEISALVLGVGALGTITFGLAYLWASANKQIESKISPLEAKVEQCNPRQVTLIIQDKKYCLNYGKSFADKKPYEECKCDYIK